MSDAEINAYLEREIINNGKIMTYRLLSRKRFIHVNAAKNALASFYARRRTNKEAIYATFWLSGEPHAPMGNGTGDEMDVDGESGRDWISRKVIIVAEEDLESARSTFSRLHALHVYSLSAAPLMNASQLCGPSHEVRELDKVGSDDFARKVGKLVSQQVKRGAQSQKSSKHSTLSKPVTTTPSTPTISKPEPKQVIQQKLKPSNSFTAPGENRSKASGKLDWSKAKPKNADKELTAKTPIKPDEVKEPRVGGGQKRGTKRKSDIMTQVQQREEEEEEEEEEEGEFEEKPINSTKSATEGISSAARIKKGVVLSDDEDEAKTTKARNSTKEGFKYPEESDAERSVRAMMDIDDSLVTKASASRHSVATDDETEEPPATDHVDSAMDEDSDDPAPKAKPRKRKQKKDIPRGKNGMPQKRIIKSKTDFDEKGYMVTVDYSSYESVDEEEDLPDEQKPKAKLKPTVAGTKKGATSQRKVIDVSAPESDAQSRVVATNTESKRPETKKSSGRPSIGKERQSNGSQKSLASFFGPGGGKSRK